MDKSKSPAAQTSQPHATTANNQPLLSPPPVMDRPNSPPPQPHATAADSSPSIPPANDNLKPPPPQPHSAAPDRRMEKLKSILLKCAANPTKEPLNPSQAALIERRLNEIPTRTPDHPPYAWMIENAIRELNEKDGSCEDSISNFIVKEQKDLPYAHDTILAHHLRRLSEIGQVVRNQNGCYSIGTRVPSRISRLDPKSKDAKRLIPFVSSVPTSSKQPHTKSSIPFVSSIPSSSEESSYSSEDSSYTSESESSYTSAELMKGKKKRNTRHNAGRGCGRGGARGRGLGRGYGRGLDPAHTNPENMRIETYNGVGEGVETEVHESGRGRAPESEYDVFINKIPDLDIRVERGQPIKREVEISECIRAPETGVRRGRGRPRKEMGVCVGAPETGIRRGRGRPRKRDMGMVVYGENVEQCEASDVASINENVETSHVNRFPEAAAEEQVEETCLQGVESREVETFMMIERKRHLEMEEARAHGNEVRRGRGRPRKERGECANAEETGNKRGRGRPRKIRMEECQRAPDTGIKRGRGRPRKRDIEAAEFGNNMKFEEASEDEAFVLEEVENIRPEENFPNMVLNNGEAGELAAVEENREESRLQQDLPNMTNMKEGESELEHKQELPDLNKELLQLKEAETEIIGQEKPSSSYNAKAGFE